MAAFFGCPGWRAIIVIRVQPQAKFSNSGQANRGLACRVQRDRVIRAAIYGISRYWRPITQ